MDNKYLTRSNVLGIVAVDHFMENEARKNSCDTNGK